jgi:hypothetical protein
MRNSENQYRCVDFEVLTAVTMKMAVFWVVAPCRPVRVYLRFIVPMMKAARTPETLVNFYQTTRRHSPVLKISQLI